VQGHGHPAGASDAGSDFATRLALRVAQLSSDLVLVIDARSGIPTQINDRLRTALGIQSDFDPARLNELLHPDDMRRLRDQRRQASMLPEGGTVYAEYRLRHADGHWCWLRERSTVLTRAADGSPQQLLCVARNITREMQAQASIEASASRFAVALAASGVAMFEQDRELRYTWIHNPTLGLSAQQVLGRRDSDVLERREEGLHLESIKRRAMLERRRVVEEVCMHSQGQPSWWRLTIEPTFDRTGAVTGVTCAAYDITPVRQQHETLAHNIEQLRVTLHCAQVGTWRFDVDSQRLWADEYACELHGVPPRAVGRKLEEATVHILSADQPQARAALQAQIRAAQPLRVDYRVRLPDGGLRWIACRGEYLAERRCVMGTVQDITDWTAVEIERNRNLAQLNALIDNAPVGIAFADRDFRLLRVNRMLASITGMPAEQMVGRVTAEAVPGLWAQLEPLYRAVKDEGRTVVDAEIAGPVRIGAPPRTYLCNYFPVPLPDGEVGIGVVVADISERKQVERELLAAKQAADDANAAKDRFLATLSHELRTPLTPILLSARILELKPDDRATVLGRAEVIRRSVETEVRLIDDLLDLTRISRDKIGLVAAPVSLHEVVIEAVEVCEADARAARVVLHLDLAASDHLVKGDPQRLQQVLWNLLKNAIKFSPDGGQVTVRTDNPDDRTVRISVRDQGIGIAAPDLPRLFQPFEQGDASITRQFGGLGLGLAIVQRLVALHGGLVHAESGGAGKGACFIVTLPLMPTRAERRADAAVEALPTRRSSGRVLLVEDHVDTAHTLGTLLRVAGWQVEAAPTAAAAVDAAAAGGFDLLVSDLSLPDGDGCELLMLLRQRGFTPPAIAMTGHGMDADQARTRQAGFARHFIKPVEVAELLAVMDQLTARRDAPAG
jgi:PAS domain S-box-containing protein